VPWQPLKTVVTISRNEPLQMTRTELLHRAGYSVFPLTSDADVTHGRHSSIAPTKTVITIGRDEPLQMTMTALLLHAGYSVVALTTDAEVMKYLALDGRPSINSPKSLADSPSLIAMM